jgi:hypothetical protein
MHRVKKYFIESSATDYDHDEERSPALGIPLYSDDPDDSELQAAISYIKSVRNEAKSSPFAVVAEFPNEAPQIVSEPAEVEAPISSLHEAVLEYFMSLRMLLNKEGVEKSQIVIDFDEDIENKLLLADSVSISNAIEDLPDLRDEFSKDLFTKWLFGLLVYLSEPLLEDTGAALQRLRRFCDVHSREDPRLGVCAIIIREYFNQR